MKTFGRYIAIQTGGPDSVEDIESTEADVKKNLSYTMFEQMKVAQVLGYEIDADSVKSHREVHEDHILIGYEFSARQTRGLIERIVWAIKL